MRLPVSQRVPTANDEEAAEKAMAGMKKCHA
jgi:hypothetical protein